MTMTLSGTNGLTFPNNATQTVAGIGSGTLTANLYGSSRALTTAYTNSTGKPLVVYINSSNSPSNGYLLVYINGVNVMQINQYGTQGGMCFIVPSGLTYQINASGASINSWYEFS